MLKFNKFLCLVVFLFNQSKNNAVFEPRTGHFRGLLGFEAMAKDLSFEARPKTSSSVLEDVLEAKDVLKDTTSVNYISDSQPRLFVVLFVAIIKLLKMNLFRTVYVNFIKPFFISIAIPLLLKQ